MTERILVTPGLVYFVDKLIGRGGAAKVLKCRVAGSIQAPDIVAIKEFDHSDSKQFQHLLGEIKLLRAIKHQNVPRYLDHFYTIERDGTKRHFLVEEFIEGPTLLEFVKKRVSALRDPSQGPAHYDLAMILVIAISIMGFIEFMHRHDLAHRDIAARNIILKNGYIDELYFIDLGTAISLKRGTEYTRVVTRGYAPPEQCHPGEVVGMLSDVYSLGATLILLLTGQEPWRYLKYDDSLAAQPIADESPNLNTDALLHDAVIPDVPSEFAELIEGLVRIDPQARSAAVSRIQAGAFYDLIPKVDFTRLIPGIGIVKRAIGYGDRAVTMPTHAHRAASLRDEEWLTHFEEPYYERGDPIPEHDYWLKMDLAHRERARRRGDSSTTVHVDAGLRIGQLKQLVERFRAEVAASDIGTEVRSEIIVDLDICLLQLGKKTPNLAQVREAARSAVNLYDSLGAPESPSAAELLTLLGFE